MGTPAGRPPSAPDERALFADRLRTIAAAVKARLPEAPDLVRVEQLSIDSEIAAIEKAARIRRSALIDNPRHDQLTRHAKLRLKKLRGRRAAIAVAAARLAKVGAMRETGATPETLRRRRDESEIVKLVQTGKLDPDLARSAFYIARIYEAIVAGVAVRTSNLDTAGRAPKGSRREATLSERMSDAYTDVFTPWASAFRGGDARAYDVTIRVAVDNWSLSQCRREFCLGWPSALRKLTFGLELFRKCEASATGECHRKNDGLERDAEVFSYRRTPASKASVEEVVASFLKTIDTDQTTIEQLIAAVETTDRQGIGHLVQQVKRLRRADAFGLPIGSLTAEEVAEATGLNLRTVRRAVKSGELKPIELRGSRLHFFEPSTVTAWRRGPETKGARGRQSADPETLSTQPVPPPSGATTEGDPGYERTSSTARDR